MHVRPAKARDLADLATIAAEAMFDDELTTFLAPHSRQHPECLRQGFLRRAKRRFYSGHLLLAAVTDEEDAWWDGTEHIVGYLSATTSRQRAVTSRQPFLSWNSKKLSRSIKGFQLTLLAFELQLLELEERFIWYTHSDRSIDRANWSKFENHLGDRGPPNEIKDYWEVNHLSVHPSYHRRGIGSALVEHVRSLATKEHQPIVLLASVQGRPMYRKLGFTELGAVDYGAGTMAEAMAWYPER